MTPLEDRVLAADIAFTAFMDDVACNAERRYRLFREHVVVPIRDELARHFQAETERLTVIARRVS